jgi:hypothetical protein
LFVFRRGDLASQQNSGYGARESQLPTGPPPSTLAALNAGTVVADVKPASAGTRYQSCHIILPLFQRMFFDELASTNTTNGNQNHWPKLPVTPVIIARVTTRITMPPMMMLPLLLEC